MPHARSLLIALAVVVTVAACGSSGTPHRHAGTAQGIKFAACMRAHGVPGFPDPSGGGGGIHISVRSGINPSSPSFQAARTTCAKLLPGGGPPTNQHPSAHAIAQARATSQCMREHGVTGFPDPTFTPPTSPAGYGAIEDRDGIVIAIPDTINMASPGFKQAALACSFS
jgi:hypothetical protein